MTSQEMMRTKSKLGGWTNIAALEEEPNWMESFPPESVDPNKLTIFGYDEADFLAKQYK